MSSQSGQRHRPSFPGDTPSAWCMPGSLSGYPAHARHGRDPSCASSNGSVKDFLPKWSAEIWQRTEKWLPGSGTHHSESLRLVRQKCRPAKATRTRCSNKPCIQATLAVASLSRRFQQPSSFLLAPRKHTPGPGCGYAAPQMLLPARRSLLLLSSPV